MMRTLRPYQLEGVQTAVERNVLLNFSCGLGKSVTAIEAVKAMRAAIPQFEGAPRDALVLVSPKVAVQQWCDEIAAQDEGASIAVIDGGEVTPVKFGNLQQCWFVTHHETLLDPKAQKVLNGEWLCVIADESHRFKNKDALRTKALNRLKAVRKIAMTGTKVEKSVADMWANLHLLDAKTFSSYWRFHERYVLTVPGYDGRQLPVGVKPETKAELAALIKPYILRKTRAQVAPELPAKRVSIISVPMEPDQRKVYDVIRRAKDIEIIDRNLGLDMVVTNAATKVLRLQQAASYPSALLPCASGVGASKLEWVGNYAANNQDEQMVIFTRFRKTAQALAKLLDAVLVLGGQEAKGLADFKAGKKQCLVGTISAAGTALDLPMAGTCIFVELERSTIQLRQAVDRIHRMTTVASPHIIFLMAKGSVDWYILDHLTKKLKVDDNLDKLIAMREEVDAEPPTVTEESILGVLEGEYA